LISFAKAHACGNDFLIVTEDAAAKHNWADLARQLCARNTGIGADGVAAWMANEVNAQPGDDLAIETDAGVRMCRIESRNGNAVEVTTGMGIPAFEPKTVSLPEGVSQNVQPGLFRSFRWQKKTEDSTIDGIVVSMGNPHFVIAAEDALFKVDSKAWSVMGCEICMHRDFPNQTNVEFFHVAGPNEIEIRIWERGVGPTSSSGTGSSAAATAAIAQGLVHSPLRVVAPGGPQVVTWNGPGEELHLRGPATLIARGEAWYE
jgi:diaminopimelate epimerase